MSPHPADPSLLSDGSAGEKGLRATGLTYGDRLRDVDLAVAPGQALGVVGRSGAGKTTLVRLLLGLLAPTAGAATWRGAPVPPVGARPTGRGAGARARAVRRELTYVPQHPAASLDPRRTVARSVADPLRRLGGTGDRPEDEAVAAALAAVGLEPHLAHHRPAALSGGQAQRAAIARALVTGARVVVADEPVSGLDPDLAGQVVDLLAGLVAERRVGLVWVSHDLDATARLCDHLLVLDDGAPVESGATRRVLTAPAHPATRALLDARPGPASRSVTWPA